MSASGGEAQRISFGQGRYATPVWSPRGDMIAFTKIDGGRFHIGVMRTDGSGEKLLTGSYLDEGPTWAPNGRVLMFFRETPGAGGRAADLFGGHHRAEPETGADGGLRLRPVVVGAAGLRPKPGKETERDRMKKITTRRAPRRWRSPSRPARGRSDVTVPGEPGSATAAAPAALGGLEAAPAGRGGGTLPGSTISDRVLFAVDQTTLSRRGDRHPQRADRLAEPEPGRRRS